LKDGSMTAAKATQLLQALDRIDSVLGIFYQPPASEAATDNTVEDGETGSIPAEVTALLEQVCSISLYILFYSTQMSL
jgi:hypothetical protein